ncbi:MAG: L-aspartate oxidase [Spirochaetes bacterium]|nr:L-aspartate oxidase [Spirochaetota bacterium]
MIKYESDILVIGSGIAGMSAAHYAAENGFSVNIITKGDIVKDSNTYYAQGGIIYRGEKDSPDSLIKDIISAGAHLSLPENVRILATEGVFYIQDLLIGKAKINFTKDEGGQFDLTEEAAHSVRRIIHSNDSTGKAIANGLYRLIKKNKMITFFDHHLGIDLIINHVHSRDKLSIYDPPEVQGAFVLDTREKEIKIFTAKAVILASGGLGQIYKYTTNPLSATGDGFAMAERAGAQIINMEYTQFHPTALYIKKPNMFLISEALRGEGAQLKTIDNKDFMKKYHPGKSLAPRDVVARAIQEEMLKNQHPYVHLDIHSYLPSKIIKKKFPTIYKTCLENKINITKEPIPVVPAFHYICGGVKVDKWGRSGIRRLFSAGEASCTGIHGANRLASTSLLESLVWGGRIIKYISENTSKYKLNRNYKIKPIKISSHQFQVIDPACIKQDWSNLQNIMWNYVGLTRSKKRLTRALNNLKSLSNMIFEFYQKRKYNIEVIELKNAVQTAIIITRSALKNRRSNGTHYRID